MFERFTPDARQVVVDAVEECRRLHDPGITSVHLLLALTREERPLADLLARHGLSRAALDEHAADALRTQGIDVDAVRTTWQRILARGVPGRALRRTGQLPVRSDAKKCLELSLREAVRLKSGEIRVEHLALGILRDPGPLLRPILVALAVDVPALRRDLELRLRPAA
jgi:ATP-dependent Clp protease ATP-binding subunit ClpA